MTEPSSLALRSRYVVVVSDPPGWFILCDRETMRPLVAKLSEGECWEHARISDALYKSFIEYAKQGNLAVPKISDLHLPSSLRSDASQPEEYPPSGRT